MSLLKKASIITTPTAYAEDYLYSIKPAYALGSELVTNGTFDTDSDWTFTGSGVNISNGKLNFTGTTREAEQSISLISNRKYRVSFEVLDYSSGDVRVELGSGLGTVRNSNGVYVEDIEFTGTPKIQIDATSFFTGSIDNVSVKEITDADFDFDRNSTGTRVNEDYLIEDVPYNLVDKSEEQEDWTIFAYGGASIVRTPNQQSPFYDNKAVLFDFTAGTGSNGILVTRNATVGANMNNTLSVWMKGVVGGEIVKVACRNTSSTGNDIGTVTITNQWKRYTFTIANNLSTTDRGFQFRFTSSDSVPTQSLFVYGTQLVKGDQPKEYLKTTDRLDIPRIDYTNGEPSILLEPQRTNVNPESENFNSGYTFTNVTTNANALTSPQGLDNAYEMIDNATNGNHRFIRQITGCTNGVDYTYSIFLKKGTMTTVSLNLFSGGTIANASVNLKNGTISGGAGKNHSIQDMGNEWYRCSITGTSGDTSVYIYLYMKELGAYVGANDNLYIYGAQLEQGSYATSLIHTSGSAVTRSADAATNAGNSDLINSTEGVLYTELKILANDGTFRVITLNDGTQNNVIEYRYRQVDNQIQFLVRDGGSVTVNSLILFTNLLEHNKIAFQYKANDFKIFANGREIGTDTSGTVPSGLNQLDFDFAGSSNFYGNVKSVMVFKEALTDLELEKLTGYNNHELYMNYYNRLSYLGLVEEYNVESDINNYIL